MQTNAECWANGLGMNQHVSKIIAEVKLSLIFNVILKSKSSLLNLPRSVDNRPSISAITERKPKPRNGSCSNQKHNCTTLQPLKEGKKTSCRRRQTSGGWQLHKSCSVGREWCGVARCQCACALRAVIRALMVVRHTAPSVPLDDLNEQRFPLCSPSKQRTKLVSKLHSFPAFRFLKPLLYDAWQCVWLLLDLPGLPEVCKPPCFNPSTTLVILSLTTWERVAVGK